MNPSTTLERRYRHLMALYPRRFRGRREDEMVSVLMDGAGEDQRWPRREEAADLLRHSASSHISQGPPPGSFAARRPRAEIAIRLAVSVWLIIVSCVLTALYSPWFLLLLTIVAIHLLLMARTAFGRRGGEPPTPNRSASGA